MKFLGLFIVLFIFSVVKAQDINGLINEQSYGKAWKKCQKILQKNPDDTEALFYLSKIQSRISAIDFFNPELALRNGESAKRFYNSISDEKTLQKLDKIPINITEFRILFDSISKGGLYIAFQINSEQSFNQFLEVYGNIENSDRARAIAQRNQLAFESATIIHTIGALEDFMGKYPDAKEYQDAILLRNKIAYDNALALNTIEAFS